MSLTSTPRTLRAQAGPGTWAERLARRRNAGLHSEHAVHPETLLDAIAGLWTLFDSATVQANVAFEQYGLPDRVVVEGTNVERRYCLADPEGPERAVTVSLAMPVPDGFTYGGAFVGISRTRSTMYLTPEVDGEHVQWVVPA